jgi:glycosyltransferase involved in cell wall biosynthesis
LRTLTILICTHNRAGLLERTLASLNAAVRPAGWDVGVLVAANACTDDTHAFLERYAGGAESRGDLPVTWFAEPTPGKSHALNSAMPRVQGDLVAFVDDDHRVDGGYLQAVCQAAESFPDADLFCGRIIPDWDGSEPAWVHDQGPYRIYPLPVPRFELGDSAREVRADDPIPGGGNLFLRTEWLARIGPFATDMGPIGHDLGGAEDREWVMRGQRLGARLWYAPGAVQYHYVDASRLTLSYVIRKAYKRTVSTVCVDPRDDRRGVPRYLYRKLAEYAFNACTALGQSRRRFYLVRTAAALGEIVGHRQGNRRGHAGIPASGNQD